MKDADLLSDDYVASLLASDAKQSAIKYSALGMEAFLPSKVPVNKPKPNTRFLRNIIQETDNHNAALLAKEAAESRARLRSLVTKSSHSGSDVRRRQLGQITAHLTSRPTKRRRSVEDAKSEEHKRRRNTSSPSENSSHVPNGRTKPSERRRSDRREEDRDHRSSHHRSHRRHRSRSGERSARLDDKSEDESLARSPSPKEHRSRRSRRRHRSPDRRPTTTLFYYTSDDAERKHGRSNNHRKSLARTRNDTETERPKEAPKSSQSKAIETDEDSDPLDEIIGPRPLKTPKIRSRGRGTQSTASGIDYRFSTDYDPTADIQPDSGDEHDWDQALEAIRDRQKWNQQGAERLRAAGFTEEEVEKWRRGGEKKQEHVTWAKKGESREWDKGKNFSIGSEDELPKDVDLDFGRLKGT